MIRQDFILRMIEQIAALISQLLYKNTHDSIRESNGLLNSVSLRLLGLGYDVIEKVHEEKLYDFLCDSDEDSIVKCFTVAELLRNHAVILKNGGLCSEAGNRFAKSLFFYFKIFDSLDGACRDKAKESILEVLDELDDGFICSTAISIKRIEFFYAIGMLSSAVNFLFELIEEDWESGKNIGQWLYSNLQTMSEETLKAGNLSSEEVKQGLAEYEKMVGV